MAPLASSIDEAGRLQIGDQLSYLAWHPLHTSHSVRMTLEFTRLRKAAKPPLAGRVQRRVRPQHLAPAGRW
jgi:hypothetical protein